MMTFARINQLTTNFVYSKILFYFIRNFKNWLSSSKTQKISKIVILLNLITLRLGPRPPLLQGVGILFNRCSQVFAHCELLPALVRYFGISFCFGHI